MAAFNVLVHVEGGVVQSIELSDDEINVIVVDWDDITGSGGLPDYTRSELDMISNWAPAAQILDQFHPED